MPSLAISEGLVVTPSNMPRSLASLICARLAVSIKNFILKARKIHFRKFLNEQILVDGNKIKKASYLHRTATTTYPCYLPALGDSAGAGRIRLAAANIPKRL